MRSVFIFVALAVLACGAAQPVAAPAPATSVPAPSSSASAAPAIEPQANVWLSDSDRENVVAGKVWDANARHFIDQGELARRMLETRFILLGERHDNPDHHRRQADCLWFLATHGRRPGVVFEMLDVSQQAALDQYRAGTNATAAGLGSALGWERTSWPPFAQYQPIFEAAFGRDLALFAGNLRQIDAKALVKRGVAALPAERVKELRLQEAFPPRLQAALIGELRASHCGQLPEELLEPMALAQHARDAQMAKALAAAGASDGAVLIAGAGHVRRDRGVPYYMALEAPNSSVMSLAFREVRDDDGDAYKFAADEPPFDYMYFTPRGSDDDPCANFHAPAK